MTDQKKEHLNDDDLFSLIPDDVAKLIAGICSKTGGVCVCTHVGNAFREATGKPQFNTHSEERAEAVRVLKDCALEIAGQRSQLRELLRVDQRTERLLAMFESQPSGGLDGAEEDVAWRATHLAESLEKRSDA